MGLSVGSRGEISVAIDKFTEAKLEEAIIQLLGDQGYPYTRGTDLDREPSDVLIRSDLREFLASRYAANQITDGENPTKTKLTI